MATKAQFFKRSLLLFVLLIVIVLGAGVYYGVMLTHDPGFDWENPNNIELKEANRKLALYETSRTNKQEGFVRFSQLELNSYLVSNLTNHLSNTNSEGVHLRTVGVAVNATNFTVYSWGEYRMFNYPLRFVIQRDMHVAQESTNTWTFPLQALRIGAIDIPQRFWSSCDDLFASLDAPVIEHFTWTTNIPALLVRKNDQTRTPELRLYTHKPIPPGDLP